MADERDPGGCDDAQQANLAKSEFLSRMTMSCAPAERDPGLRSVVEMTARRSATVRASLRFLGPSSFAVA